MRKHFEIPTWTPVRDVIRLSRGRDWLVDGLIREGDLVILVANPKVEKSLLALNLAGCIAAGKPFLGLRVKQGRSLFVDYRRFWTTVRRAFMLGLDAYEDLMVWDAQRFGTAPHAEKLDWWWNFVTKHHIKLIVVNSLSFFLRNYPIISPYIREVLSNIAEIASDTGCSFLFTHHTNKKKNYDMKSVMGDSAITSTADVILLLEPLGRKTFLLKAVGKDREETTIKFAFRGVIAEAMGGMQSLHATIFSC